MAHCFRWKIILPSAKRLGIDTSDHRLYERDVQRVWLGALTFKKNSDERELLAETPRSFCVAAGMRLKTMQLQRNVHRDTVTTLRPPWLALWSGYLSFDYTGLVSTRSGDGLYPLTVR